MFELDKLDRKILLELDCNSRQSMSQLARRLRQARDTVEYRVQKLQQEGVITKFTAMVDPARLGFTVYNVYLRLAADKQERQRLLKSLQQHSAVSWIAECAGQWDLIFALAVRTKAEFYQAHTALLSEFSSIVLESTVHTVVDVWICAKDYVLNATSGRHVHFEQQADVLTIDSKDQLLLTLLMKDSRTSLTEAARLIKLSSEATARRIQRLEENRIIAGYRIEIDLERLNKQHFKAQIFFHRFTKEVEETFRRFCLEHPNITHYFQEIGPCPVELEMEVKSYARYHEILDQLRELSPGTVRNIHTILLRNTRSSWNWEKAG